MHRAEPSGEGYCKHGLDLAPVDPMRPDGSSSAAESGHPINAVFFGASWLPRMGLAGPAQIHDAFRGNHGDRQFSRERMPSGLSFPDRHHSAPDQKRRGGNGILSLRTTASMPAAAATFFDQGWWPSQTHDPPPCVGDSVGRGGAKVRANNVRFFLTKRNQHRTSATKLVWVTRNSWGNALGRLEGVKQRARPARCGPSTGPASTRRDKRY